MKHYFIASEHSEDEYFTFTDSVMGENFTFRSCPDVFSKDQLDYGSLVLIQSIIKHKDVFGGDIMDMCCGYGTIAIILSRFINANYYLSDINSTAVELAKENINNNSAVINVNNVFVSNMFEDISNNFDHVVSNPPIKAGKKNLLNFVDGAYSHLKEGGTITLVIKKNLGEDSLRKYIISLFGNCEIWERNKGYYILHAVK